MTLPVEQLSASEAKAAPRCRHFGPCGGCTLQHLPYEEQVRLKAVQLAEILQRELAPQILPKTQVVASPDPWSYRSKMEFSFGEEKGRLTVGLHERGNFRKIVEIERCEIAPEPVSRLLVHLRRIAERFSLRSYHPRSQRGFWRHAVIRSGRAGGELLLLLMTNEGPSEPVRALARELPSAVPELKSFYWGISTRLSDVARPERMERLFGAEGLDDEVAGIRYRMGPMNFVQPNRLLAPTAYRTIREEAALTGRETVYDLYCGVGILTLLLAEGAGTAYGVESEQENIESAQRNAVLNGRANAVFLCGKTEDLVKGQTLFRLNGPPDCVVLDPPRVGLHPEVIAALSRARPRTLLYLSCNPASLTRDLRMILERQPAYRVEALRMFDFFPHTPHMEVLATLRYN